MFTAEGLRIHYLYDTPDPSNPWINQSGYHAMQDAKSQAGLVYEDEIYSSMFSGDWTRVAPNCGITFGARQISVFVELPDDYPVTVDGYRQFLRFREGEQAQLSPVDFAAEIRAHRPEWLLALMRGLAPDLQVGQDVQGRLRQIIRELGLKPPPKPPAEASGKPPAPAAATDAAPKPPAPANPDAGFLPAPEIYFLDTPVEADERSMVDRAARFYPESGQIYVNLLYPGFRRFEEAVLSGVADLGGGPEVAAAVREQVEHAVALRIGSAVVTNLAKRGWPQPWPNWAIDTACGPEALSTLVDEYWSLLDTVGKAVRQRVAAV